MPRRKRESKRRHGISIPDWLAIQRHDYFRLSLAVARLHEPELHDAWAAWERDYGFRWRLENRCPCLPDLANLWFRANGLEPQDGQPVSDPRLDPPFANASPAERPERRRLPTNYELFRRFDDLIAALPGEVFAGPCPDPPSWERRRELIERADHALRETEA